MERKKAFQKIRVFLKGNGFKAGMNKSDMIKYICTRYTPVIAQKLLDLVFGEDPYNTTSIYYKQDLAYSIDCEELTERLKNLDEVFRNNNDPLYRYTVQKGLFPSIKDFF